MSSAPTASRAMVTARVPEAGAGSVRALRAELQAHLQGRAKRLNEEINRYPTPIARCDQHLAALLDLRAAVYSRLNRLETLPASVSALEAFLAAPTDGAEDVEEALRSRLRTALAKQAVPEPEKKKGPRGGERA